MSSEEEDWGNYVDDSEEEDSEGGSNESENEVENMFYEAEGKQKAKKLKKRSQELGL